MKKNTVMSIGKHLIVMSVIFAMLIGILPESTSL